MSNTDDRVPRRLAEEPEKSKGKRGEIEIESTVLNCAGTGSLVGLC